MKRTITATMFLIPFVSLFVLGPLRVPDVQAQGRCGDWNVKGKWTILCNGTATDATSVTGVYSYVGLWTLDGFGNHSGSATIRNSDGTISEFTFAGTYTVDSNCSMAVESTASTGIMVRHAKVLNSNKNEIRGILTYLELADGTVLEPLPINEVCVDKRQ